MLLSFLRFLRGWVGFTVSGRYPERFLNITSRKRIRLWDVRRREEGFSACMYRTDYLHIRSAARGAGVRLKLSGKYGLPDLLYRYRGRAGLLLGAGAFILTVFISSLFVWSVDIRGLETVSYADMKAVLREHGLYAGAFKPSLDYRQITRDILLERHEIGWMAVNVSGSYASVEIKEEAPPPEVEDVGTPCNVKADMDGLILRIEAREGETVLTEGSGVIEGQLIVSGVREDESGGSRLVHADARVLARTTRQASFSVPEEQTVAFPDGEAAERSSLFLSGLRIPFGLGAVDSPYSVVDEAVFSPDPLGVTLPVGIVRETVSPMSLKQVRLNENSAKELLLREAKLYEVFALPDCTVEERDCRLDYFNGTYTLIVTYTCVENIAYKEAIGTE